MNRRGFIGALLAAPVAAVAAVAATKKQSTLSPATYTWRSFHDGFGIHEEALREAFGACSKSGGQPDMILCSEDFYQAFTGTLSAARKREIEVQSLRRMSRKGSPAVRRAAFKKLHELKHPTSSAPWTALYYTAPN